LKKYRCDNCGSVYSREIKALLCCASVTELRESETQVKIIEFLTGWFTDCVAYFDNDILKMTLYVKIESENRKIACSIDDINLGFIESLSQIDFDGYLPFLAKQIEFLIKKHLLD
jgi:hypothetical protein